MSRADLSLQNAARSDVGDRRQTRHTDGSCSRRPRPPLDPSSDAARECRRRGQHDQLAAKRHVSFEGTQMSIYRKVGGQWHLAAMFARPNE